MKIHHLLFAAALSITMTSNAQWPASINFNTANNNLGGVVGVGSADLVWKCSPSFAGPFVQVPRQVTPASGWHLGNTAPTFPPTAEWISFPHTCDASDPRIDHCGCAPYAACTNDFYEYEFTLPTAGPWTLPLTMMADNCIVAVFLNNVPVYNAPPAQLAAGAPNWGGYLYAGFQAGNQVNINLTSGFVAGLNSLKVHVRSGINTANQGWTGFICFHSGCYRCDVAGEEEDPRDPKDPEVTGKCVGVNCDNPLMKEQQALIEQQQLQISELKEAATQTDATATTISLSDKNTLVLNQNVPNPFAESTVISYSIPQGFARAQLIFRTSEGMLIKTIDITQAGKGSVTVFADDLSRGTYSYSLVIDGKEVDSKKMIKE